LDLKWVALSECPTHAQNFSSRGVLVALGHGHLRVIDVEGVRDGRLVHGLVLIQKLDQRKSSSELLPSPPVFSFSHCIVVSHVREMPQLAVRVDELGAHALAPQPGEAASLTRAAHAPDVDVLEAIGTDHLGDRAPPPAVATLTELKQLGEAGVDRLGLVVATAALGVLAWRGLGEQREDLGEHAHRLAIAALVEARATKARLAVGVLGVPHDLVEGDLVLRKAEQPGVLGIEQRKHRVDGEE
jgi:hypothetical protein